MDAQIKTISEWLGTGSINIFGLPFAGKDTQGRILADMFGGAMISGGDILRHSTENEKIQKIMASGGIIPSDLFEDIVLPYLSRPEFKGKPLILSEVGRLRGEDEVIIRATTNSGHPQKAVILLHLPEDEIWNRFDASKSEHDRGERADDRREVLQTRLDNFRIKVIPVIDYYRSLGLLIEVDGTLPRQQVTDKVLENLLNFASRA